MIAQLVSLLQAGANRLAGSTFIPAPPCIVKIDCFALTDSKACLPCIEDINKRGVHAKCNHEMMVVKTTTPVGIIDIDTWLSAFPHKVKEGLCNCDYLIADAVNRYAVRKIAFCDLTCSHPAYLNPGRSKEYPEGKRNYMLKQMVSMVTWLINDDLLKVNIFTNTERCLVFGIRHRQLVSKIPPASAMSGFMRTPSSAAKKLTSSQYIQGISFETMEVLYPNPFLW